MIRFLASCRDDFFLTGWKTPLFMEPTFVKYHFESVVRQFEYMASLIVKSAAVKAELYAGDPRKDTLLVIRFGDPYEAFIMALHLDMVKYYVCDEKVCAIPHVSSLKIYEYGLRSIAQDIPNFRRLARGTRYLALLDARRCGGSVKAVINSLRNYGVEPEESILLAFDGLGEAVYETLGAYILRCRGYLVVHQGCISSLLPPPYSASGVPDLETAYVGSKGFFLYELSLLKELGREVKLSITSVGVGEVKSSKYDFSEGLHQLLGYLSSGLYDEGYLVVPDVADRVNEVREYGAGLVTWDSSGSPYVVKAERRWGDKERIEAFKEVLSCVLSIIGSLFEGREG